MELAEKIKYFEQALSSLELKEKFEQTIKDVVLKFIDSNGDLTPLSLFRLTNHISLLSEYNAKELATRYEELLETGTYSNPIERFWKNRKNG